MQAGHSVLVTGFTVRLPARLDLPPEPRYRRRTGTEPAPGPAGIEPQGMSPRLSSVIALAKALQAFTCSYRSRSSRSNDWARSAVRLWKR